MTQIVEVQFQSDRIQTLRQGDSVWVVARRVCDALEIDPDSQHRRLRDPERSPWATTAIMTAVAGDGKNREVFAVHLDTLPMWLATIDASRVRPEAREKLLAYQRECARVLRDHFFGASTPASAELASLREALMALTQVVTTLAHRVNEIDRRHSSGIAGPWEIAGIRRRVHQSSALLCAAGRYPSKRSAVSATWSRVKVACGWSGKMTLWPAWALSEAFRELDAIDREVARLIPASAARQLQLELAGKGTN